MQSVLIVDSNNDFRKSLSTALTRNFPDTTFIEAANGLDAVQKAGKFKPNIVLVDVSLTFLNGLEVIDKVKKIINPACATIVTGINLPEYLEAAKESGVDYFLPKNSISLADIMGLVKDLLCCNQDTAQKWRQYRAL